MNMLNFFYWASGILVTIILSYVTFKYMNKIKNVKIHQKGERLTDVTGVDVELGDGENIHVKNMDIKQEARQMNNVTGLSVKAAGKQSLRLQGVNIEQPGVSVKISDDPNVNVTINNQDYL